jgi:hypothetical protein
MHPGLKDVDGADQKNCALKLKKEEVRNFLFRLNRHL